MTNAPASITEQLAQRRSFLTTTEVMAILGVARQTLCKWVRDGVIPAIRIGKDNKFDPAAVIAWLEARRV